MLIEVNKNSSVALTVKPDLQAQVLPATLYYCNVYLYADNPSLFSFRFLTSTISPDLILQMCSSESNIFKFTHTHTHTIYILKGNYLFSNRIV